MAPSPREAIALRTQRRLGAREAHGDDVWHPAALASRAVECFDAVQSAWTGGDAQGLARYVSESMHARIDSWFHTFENRSQVNRIDNLSLEHATPRRIEFGTSAEQDRLVVDIGFSARDWLEDTRTGAIVDGDPNVDTRFDQRWTFVRDPELGWVVDTVDPLSAELPSPGAHGRSAPDSRRRPAASEPTGAPRPAVASRLSPARQPAPSPEPPAHPRPSPSPRPEAAPGRRRAIPGHPGAAPVSRRSRRGKAGGALRVALLGLLCVALVAGAARVGLSLGRDSVANPADAERARAEARQTVAGPTFRQAFGEAQARGRATGLARGRRAGRIRGARQGRRAGRAEGQRQADARAAAAAATAAANRRAAARAATPPRAAATTPRR